MKKQKQYRQISQSRKRVQSVFQEEEEVSKAFQITNFYTNQRLNIGQLKQRLQKFKRTQFQSSKPQGQTHHKQRFSQFNNFPSIEGNKYTLNEQQKSKQIVTSFLTPKQDLKKKGYDKDKQMQNYLNAREYQTQKLASRQFEGHHYNIPKKQDIKSINYKIIKQINNHRYDSKTKTSYGLRQNQKQQLSKNTINYYHNIKGNKSKSNAQERTQNSRISQRSHNNSILQELHVQGRIVIANKNQLYELQKHIHVLWQHYQLLTKLLLALKEGKNQQKNAIVKYVQDICSDKFQFIRVMIQAIKKGNPSKVQESFMKRIKKTVILSRLYQNLSILYVSLDICFRKLPDSHLVNYIGYCSSNVIFLLRFTQLVHNLPQSLQFSQNTHNILAVISQFQNESYKNYITKIGDLILRMQHNNQTIAIIQNRLCNNINKQFQDTIHKFIKNVDIESKILFQYGHYIFQYLAYYLASIKIVGQFSFIQIAPSPYFPLSKKRTLVIEPWEVLFAFKDTNTYLRAYSEQFLTEIGKHWNIIYWTDLMPEKIDDLIQRLPFGKRLYLYHCRYENQRFLKLLWRIGSDTENTIIIDRQQSNFKYDKQMGLQLPWKGKGKDTKLLDILTAFTPLLNSDASIPLRKSFPLVKQHLMGTLKKSRQKRLQSKGNQLIETNGTYPKNLKLPQNNRFKYVQQ